MAQPIINLEDYTVLQHILFALGCLLWVFTYIVVLKVIKKSAFIEIPLIAVTANFAWEFLWSFVFMTNMGLLYVWGYRIWFFLDCFIVFNLFRYGFKQIELPSLRKRAVLIIASGIASWFLILFFYIKNYDHPISHNGAYSGYILNVMMSAMYVPLLLRLSRTQPFNVWAAWLKGVGTLLISAFCFLRYTDGFLLSMCAVTTILDATYIYLIMKRGNLNTATVNEAVI
ncbi:hypothetical protein ACE01N_02100 [Saccharicrinis sp. FJH2]|uniref:transmembrane-type terpene cyclase n=1 Tax=Saccharicrinis sp. FJH65 TaxID=3344659 RepID=UPI0035F26E37